MTIHSGILAWKIPWTEEPGRRQSTGSQRVWHNWKTNTFTFMFIELVILSDDLILSLSLPSPPDQIGGVGGMVGCCHCCCSLQSENLYFIQRYRTMLTSMLISVHDTQHREIQCNMCCAFFFLFRLYLYIPRDWLWTAEHYIPIYIFF